MIQNCKMRHENGNCLPAGGFCTANKNICEALQNAYEMGQRNVIRKKGKWIGEPNRARCSVCKVENYYAYKYDSDSGLYVQQDFFCPNCGADMRGEQNDND